MKTLTIYTPAYNRGELLKRAYESLKRQTSQDFLWMIVDDGSSDDTENIVGGFISENALEIQYIKKANGGKHTATNAALSAVTTPLIMISLDSDDFLKADAVRRIIDEHRLAPDAAGYVFMKENSAGKPLYSYFSKSLDIMSWRDAMVTGSFDGEALLILKSSYAKRFRYPEIEGERFFTEGFVYLQMTEPFVWRREAIYVAEYLDDGYTRNILDCFRRNPVCYAMYNNLRVSLYSSVLKRLKYAAYYDAFSMLSHRKGFIRDCSSSLYASLGLVPGAVFFIFLKLHKRGA